jgi:hypothetical protein
MLGNQRRFVAFFEWLTLWPNWGPFPQISHRTAIANYLFPLSVERHAILPHKVQLRKFC